MELREEDSLRKVKVRVGHKEPAEGGALEAKEIAPRKGGSSRLIASSI